MVWGESCVEWTYREWCGVRVMWSGPAENGVIWFECTERLYVDVSITHNTPFISV